MQIIVYASWDKSYMSGVKSSSNEDYLSETVISLVNFIWREAVWGTNELS